MKTVMRRALVLAAALALTWAVPAAGDSWNDRTTLAFSEPILVPGATLQPGKYVFKLLDSDSNRHLVQILSEDQSKVIATTQAVPLKRQDPKGDVVLKLNPTEPGTPPALRAWFYPGSLYGHEFVYPEHQAREIAQRTKTLVLSIDQPGTDMQKGTLRTYSPTGERVDWHGDGETMREWSEFRRSRGATTNASREATAPAVQASFQGMRVTVDQLEDDAQRYIGKQISVDAEVEEVLGPRLFTIDERQWGDLEGEILVHMPSALAALVREDDRVTISGTVKQFVGATLEREWGWLGGLDPAIDARLSTRPMLIADRIVGGNSDVALVIDARAEGQAPAGSQTDRPSESASRGSQSGAASDRSATSSSSGADAGRGERITDVAMLATATDATVGRRVHLTNVTVEDTARDRGFFIDAPNRTVFVLPAGKDQARVQPGRAVTIRGVVLQMPRGMDRRLNAQGDLNDDVYVLATSIDDRSRPSN